MEKELQQAEQFTGTLTEKGGEKTVSEWEELEKLSKDELIIELVRARTLLRLETEDDSDNPDYVDNPANGERTTEEWSRKIVMYAYKHHEIPDDFEYPDVYDYGLHGAQAEETFEKLVAEGRITRSTADPRSENFSGIPGKNRADVESMDPAERERFMESWKRVAQLTDGEEKQ